MSRMSDAIDFNAEFPILKRLAFFNHAGVAPITASAAAAVREYATQAESLAYHGARWYARAAQVKRAAAAFIGAAGEHEIAFIPNTSSGLSLVANGLDWRPGDNVVISSVEYPANRYPWENLRRLGVEVVEVQQHSDGRIDVEDVVEAITARTRVVSLSHVQYASGYHIDLRPISDMVHRAGGYLCVDAIQSLGAMPVDVRSLGIDFLAADGHKWLLSPEGCGIFYCRGDLTEMLHPSVVGWMNMVNASDYGSYQFEFQKDARRFEPGSYNIPGVLALGASLEVLSRVGMAEVWRRIEALTGRLCSGLLDKGYRLFSPRGADERSGIVVFEPPHASRRPTPPIQKIVSDLDARGIVIVVREGRLRASPHFYNTTEQIDALLDALP